MITESAAYAVLSVVKSTMTYLRRPARSRRSPCRTSGRYRCRRAAWPPPRRRACPGTGSAGPRCRPACHSAAARTGAPPRPRSCRSARPRRWPYRHRRRSICWPGCRDRRPRPRRSLRSRQSRNHRSWPRAGPPARPPPAGLP